MIRKIISIIPLISMLFFSTRIFNGVLTLKAWVFLLSVTLVLIPYIFYSTKKFTLTKYDFFLIAFTLFAAIYGSGFRVLLLSAVVVYYFILSNESAGEKFWGFMLYSLLTLSGIEALIGELQNYGMDLTGLSGFYKICGTFPSPIFFAAAITPAIPLSFGVYHSAKSKFAQNYAMAVGALLFLALSVANNRGAWLAALCGTVFFYALKYTQNIKNYFKDNLFRKISAALSIILLFFALLSALYAIRPVSADARLLMWRVSFNAFLEHPISGIGYGNMEKEYMEYQAEFFKDEKNVDRYIKVVGNVDHAHNEYVQLLAETGVIGFVLFAAFILALFYFSLNLIFENRLNERQKYYLAGALSALLSALVIAFFGYYFYFSYIAVFAFALMAVIAAILKQNGLPLITFNINRPLRYALTAASVLLFLFTAKNAYKDISSRKIWREAFMLSLSGQKQAALQKYNAIYAVMRYNGEYLFNLGALYVSADSVQKGLDLLQRAKISYSNPKLYIALGRGYEKSDDYENAIENYKRASTMMPHQMFPHYLMAKLHQKQGNKQAAASEAQKIINLPIRVKSSAVFEMKKEMKDLIEE